MRDLVRLTGVSAPAIHFYAQQGLLPMARKTADNQARYSDATVMRVRWIRSLQTDLRLSLRGIKSILDRSGELPLDEVRAMQALGSLLAEPDRSASGEELAAVRARLGRNDVDVLARLGLINAVGAPSTEDIRLMDLVAAMRGAGLTEEAGFNIENLALYRDAVEELVNSELARIIEPVLVKHDPETLRDLVRRGLPLADQLLALLHRRAVQSELRRWLEVDISDAQPASA
jgi:DNA-binding transcriptional MerR regulator